MLSAIRYDDTSPVSRRKKCNVKKRFQRTGYNNKGPGRQGVWREWSWTHACKTHYHSGGRVLILFITTKNNGGYRFYIPGSLDKFSFWSHFKWPKEYPMYCNRRHGIGKGTEKQEKCRTEKNIAYETKHQMGQIPLQREKSVTGLKRKKYKMY